ncbi:MAG: hypothetical protein HY360_07590 [Verrucomicrobia bacterium]|nr:hypothetical protein [Verrucomicrobiota bacterium]
MSMVELDPPAPRPPATGGQPAQAAAVEIVIDKIGQEIVRQRIRHDSQPGLLYLAMCVFRDFEDATHILRAPSDAERTFHRHLLTSLLALAESIVFELEENPGCVAPELLEQARACACEVRDSYQAHYGGMSADTAKGILQEVFGGPA